MSNRQKYVKIKAIIWEVDDFFSIITVYVYNAVISTAEVLKNGENFRKSFSAPLTVPVYSEPILIKRLGAK